jgi:hypothetical protein
MQSPALTSRSESSTLFALIAAVHSQQHRFRHF